MLVELITIGTEVFLHVDMHRLNVPPVYCVNWNIMYFRQFTTFRIRTICKWQAYKMHQLYLKC